MFTYHVIPAGYGTRTRNILFDGNEKNYKLCEVKFIGYLHTLKLKNELKKKNIYQAKNEEILSQLIEILDERSLALIMRDANDNGQKVIQILRERYMGQEKPKIIVIYKELLMLTKEQEEDLTDYILCAEKAVAALRNSSEVIWDSLLIPMLLKDLLACFNTF